MAKVSGFIISQVSVELISESGGFKCALDCPVNLIFLLLLLRNFLSIDLTADEDSQNVNVLVWIDPRNHRSGQALSGPKVAAHFNPQ